MIQVAVAMLGARMHYAVPRLLHEAGLLDRFFTDSYIGNKPWLEAALRVVPAGMRANAVERWLGRKDAVLPPEKVTSFDRLGLWFGWARQCSTSLVATNEVFHEAAVRFNQKILQVGLGDAGVVWGFNGWALELFETAKRQGRLCIVEQTILPLALERRLLQQEQERWPGWEKNPSDWTQPLATDGREEAEWELSDAIVAGSTFVRDGLVELGVPAEKIHVIPYGVDCKRFEAPIEHLSRQRTEAGPLKVLFAGQVGLRKGVPDLLEAVRQFAPGEIELRLAGGISLREAKLAQYQNHAEFLGHVPRNGMRDLFQWADVLVLPSIVEGSATVTYEAIMSDSPVITTPNTGSIIQDGVDGFIVPLRSPNKIGRALRRYLDEPNLLAAHRTALTETRERAGLQRYKTDLVRLVESLDVQQNHSFR